MTVPKDREKSQQSGKTYADQRARQQPSDPEIPFCVRQSSWMIVLVLPETWP